MFGEVLIYLRSVVVLLAIRSFHGIKFVQISLWKLEQLHLYSIEESLYLLFDFLDGGLGDL
jgi:hypothetical protein